MCSKYGFVSIFLPMYALLYLCIMLYLGIYVLMYDGGVDVCTKMQVQEHVYVVRILCVYVYIYSWL